MKKIISLQLEFCNPLPQIVGNRDYTELENLLIKIDYILGSNNFDLKAVRYFFEKHPEISQTQKNIKKTIISFRTTILRSLINISYRKFSIELANSQLYRWFCKIDNIAGPIKVPSKTTLERSEKYFSKNFMDDLNKQLTKLSMQDVEKNKETNDIGLEQKMEINKIFLDTTCIETNIHYPVDWKLLLDGVRSLTLAIERIRKIGIKHRMPSPKLLRSKMNKLSIKITHSQRIKHGKKQRKKAFREMKKITKKVMNHAVRYIQLFENEYKKYKVSEEMKDYIVSRMKSVLEQLPKAIRNAHERVIGGRKVLNKDKIFSLYERETEILVRRKSGKEVEFGNKFLLAENEAGLMVDYDFMKKQVSDSKLLIPMIGRYEKNFPGMQIDSITTDKSFNSAVNNKELKNKGIYNSICPKKVIELEKKLKEIKFKKTQKRRAQTEARISIFKKIFLGERFRSKGFKYREQMIACKVFAHNLWVIGRLSKVHIKDTEQQKAA